MSEDLIEPGMKAIRFTDGEWIIWPIDSIGRPHHAEIAAKTNKQAHTTVLFTRDRRVISITVDDMVTLDDAAVYNALSKIAGHSPSTRLILDSLGVKFDGPFEEYEKRVSSGAEQECLNDSRPERQNARVLSASQRIWFTNVGNGCGPVAIAAAE